MLKKMRAEPVDLDDFDLRLLDALQENNQRTSEELAELVHLSPASCLRRAKRLRDLGVICADVSVVSPEALGRRMTMIVLVALEREQHDLIDAFKASMRKTPQVMHCYYVTGAADFVLTISVSDMDEYDAFTRQFFFENRNVRRFETMVVMARTKFDVSVRAASLLD
jgi:Lrp/AsnC family transcriptional regulator, leucine-responsive regulatory protein